MQSESLHYCCKHCMGRFLSLLGCYGVQERSGANDGEGWSYIDEGRWKEGGRQKGQEAMLS